MCHWLTLAVTDAAALAPLHELGAALEPAAFPALPPHHARLHRFLVTRGGCSCDLLCKDGRDRLAEVLVGARLLADELLAHRTFGDPPRGQRALHAADRRTPREFADGGDEVAERWTTLVVRYAPGQPIPQRLDGARVLAIADDGDAALFALLAYDFVPGCTLARCDREWNLLDTGWHADDDAARAAAQADPGRPLHWVARERGEAGGEPR